MTVRRTLALGIAGLLASGAAVFTTVPAHAAPAGCTHELSRASRAGDVARNNPRAFKKAEARNARRMKDFAGEAKTDKTLWLDTCATAYYVEETATAAQQQAGDAAIASSAPLAGVPLADTFSLESKPGSDRTIYLDVTGASISGTAWNGKYGASLTFDPYSIDSTFDTNFSDAELTEIQRIWQTVAEDYAPFDVNVTLKDPGADAIDRTSATDTVYGTTAVITNGGDIYTACKCGGKAYIGVFNSTGTNHGYYQPALVFANGTGHNGRSVGEATAHEVGHNFGLNHDGNSTSEYEHGAAPWAPIMGASYYQPVSQWSKGEYPDANNQQDDLAQIATGAPVRADEDAAGPLELAPASPVNGIITSAADVDSYTFTAAGDTTVDVTGTPFSDLDVQLRVLDANGTEVVSSDPTTTKVTNAQASGLGATATFTAPSTGATYTATIQGAGQGDMTLAGSYTAYGSIGNYTVGLATGQPLDLEVGALADATVGAGYTASTVSASGGAAPYTFSATGLPAGLSVEPSTGDVSGTPIVAGGYTPTFTVTDSTGGTVSQVGAITVDPVPVPVLPLAWVTGATLPGGKVKAAYSTKITTFGGTAGYSWVRSAGNLPSGTSLTFSGPTATLSGRPTKAGTARFTLRVTDSDGVEIARYFSVVIGR